MLTFINIKLPEQGMLLCCNLFHFILNVLALGMALVTKDQKNELNTHSVLQELTDHRL